MEYPSENKTLRIVHIISGDRWAGAEVQAYTLLKELNKSFCVFAIVLNEGELAQKLTQAGITVKIFDESKLSSKHIFSAIRSQLKEWQPDAIHTHRQKENILGSIANSLSVKSRSIRTVHGAPEFKAKGKAKLQVWLNNMTAKYLQHAIIAVSEDLANQLKTFLPSKKIHTVLNGMDPYEISLGLSVPSFKQTQPEKVHVGIVGRLDSVKRIDIFLNSAAQLINIAPTVPWHFHVFGEGNLEAELKELAHSLSLNEYVTFHGHRMDIRDCINGLSVAVMCSDHEGLPMTALECLALNVPLVAHDVGGLSELLKAQPSLLVSDHSAAGYASAILQAVEQNTPACQFPAQYHIEKTAQTTAALYFPTAKHIN